MIPDTLEHSAIAESEQLIDAEAKREGKKKAIAFDSMKQPEAEDEPEEGEFYYAGFVERMRHPSARPLLARIRAFLKSFPDGTVEYHAFLADLVERAVTSTSAFQGESRENISEGTHS